MKKLLKSIITSFVFVFAVFMGTQIVLAAVSETEPNDTNLTANEIRVNTEYVGTIKDKDDKEDIYKFKLSSDGFYNLSLKTTTELSSVNEGWDMTLYTIDSQNQESEVKVIPTLDKIRTTATSVRLQLKKDINYYVRVESHSKLPLSACVNKNYILNVVSNSQNDWEAEPNDDSANANLIETGKTYHGLMNTQNDVDWYKFSITKRGYINIKLCPSTGTSVESLEKGWDYSVYQVSDLSNPMYQITEVNTREGKTSMNLTYKPGIYYVKIENHNKLVNTSVDAPYDLSITETADDSYEAEVNDDNLNATSILTGKTYHGSLNSLRDTDWYRFETTKKGFFNVKLCLNGGMVASDAKAGWNFSVYKSGDLSNPIYSGTGDITYDGLTSRDLAFAPGVFYLKITTGGVAGVNTLYDLTVTETADDYYESEGNDSSTTADILTLGKEYQALFHTYKDVDWYRFKITKKGYFNVSFKLPGKPVIENYGWTMTIYRVKDSSKAIWSESQIKTDKVTCNLPYEPGEYYIKIEPSSVASAPVGTKYSLMVTQTASSGWELEPNDTEDQANAIKLKGSIYGYITSASDKDFFKLVVPTAGKVTLNLNKVKSDANTGYGWTVQVFKNTSWSKAAMQFNVETDKGSASAKLAAGTYYVVVKANNIASAPVNVQYKLSSSYSMSAVSGVEIQNLSATSVKITWTKEAGVTGYDVYRSTSKNGTYKKVATVKTNSYTDKSLKCGSTFYYKIRKNAKIDGAAKSSPFSSIVSVKIKPAKPTLSSATNSSSKTMLVKWKVVSGISGYEIQYSLKNNFSANNKTISNISAKTAEKKITGLRAGKRYYVRLRTYKVVNGKKVYSDWSSVKNVGIK